jgi:hypothetical protein
VEVKVAETRVGKDEMVAIILERALGIRAHH